MKKEYKPYKTQIIPFGFIDNKIAKDLQDMCYASKNKVISNMEMVLTKAGYLIEHGEHYIYCKGFGDYEKIMLTAHIDTVQRQKGAGIIYHDRHKNKSYLWSPYGIGGDDRCGITAIKRIVESGMFPTILLCDLEEKGGIGSDNFNKDYKNKLDLNCIIELDRQGNNDLVFYQEDNTKWKEFLKELTGWEEEIGTFSDICNLYDLGCASVNLSVGYYNQHTRDEYIVLEDWENSIKVCKMIMKNITKKWEHKRKHSYYFDYLQPYYFQPFYEKEYEISYLDKNNELDYVNVEAESKDGAIDIAYKYYNINVENIIKIEELKSIGGNENVRIYK